VDPGTTLIGSQPLTGLAIMDADGWHRDSRHS
jgi:hypothetical protein